MPDGIDLDCFNPAGPKLNLDALAGLPAPDPGAIRVGLVATLAVWKGHEIFLRAIAQLPAELPIRAYVIGGPLYETAGSQRQLDTLRALAADLGIPAGRLGFTGYVAEPASALRALDIVVHASTRPEPFGRVIAEGMACARAVIYSRLGGAMELVREEETALGFPAGDAAALAAAIARLARDQALRERLGQQGRAWAEQRFSRLGLPAALLPFYERVLA